MTEILSEEAPITVPAACTPRMHAAGAGGVYMDCGGAAIDMDVQERIWAIAEHLRGSAALPGIREIVPGVNNLLVLFDPLQLNPEMAREHILALWQHTTPASLSHKTLNIPVIYGGEDGIDLPQMAEQAGLSITDYVALHSSAHYRVVCIGSTPGFTYLSGLPERLHAPRRSSPRLRIPKGSVIIGGVQAGIMPGDAPSGWHILGRTMLETFDAQREPACLLAPGDVVRFIAQEINL